MYFVEPTKYITPMLTERLLQFIWQFQYFNKQNLYTNSGETLNIIHPGTFNTNQGPDFLNAKIKIAQTFWAGNLEIHIKASDWLLHKHAGDENYQSVILHVVWIQDTIIADVNGNKLPTLVIEPLVSKIMLARYQQLMQAEDFVPCQSFLPALSSIAWQNWLERLLVERLEKRAAIVFEKLYKTENYWEEVLWQMLARNFGTPINADAFESIALSIPVAVLSKQKSQIQQLEALLLGQSGLLNEEFTESYALLLQREYRFLKHKYNLKEALIKPVFLRMRPANFPTIRLAQLAMLIHLSEHFFSIILEAKSYTEIIQLLNVTANDFWHYHYNISVATIYKRKVLGEQMAHNILINTITPLLFAYGLFNKNQVYKDKAIEWLAQTKPEQNTIIKRWRLLGVISDNALHTQGLLELKKHYCDLRKCLTCAAGNKILKQPD